MKNIFSFFFLLIFFHATLKAQQDSCGLQVSLLTATPGEELYSTFGHSALRVTDSLAGTDIIFNYGTFDFDDPDFYTKFVRGKLLYFVSVEDFDNFMYQYDYEKRGITEQVLQLDCNEKIELYTALLENAKEENKYYAYDFVYDNCTTRLRDMIRNHAHGQLSVKDIRPYEDVSFRNLIHEYLDRNNQYWSKFGIDLVLGSPLDKNISNDEAMFLPDYLLKAFDSTQQNGQSLVKSKSVILPPGIQPGPAPLFTPLLVFSILFIVIAIATFAPNSRQLVLSIFDFFIFFLTGLAGILLVFMWWGTDHQTAAYNYNIWWALPFHAIMAFFIHREAPWVKFYFKVTFFITVLFLLAWLFLPQQFNLAILPLTGIILLRSWIISKKQPYAKT